jgi:hypothetical protein
LLSCFLRPPLHGLLWARKGSACDTEQIATPIRLQVSDFNAELKKIGAARQATLQKKLKNEDVPGDQQGCIILCVVAFDGRRSEIRDASL